MSQRKEPRPAEPLGEETPSEVVAQQIRKFRKERGWSARVLAERCAKAGMPAVDRAVIANLENKRRKGVTVDELLMFAYVLDVAPVNLLVPDEDVIEDEDATEMRRTVRITPDVAPSPTETRWWIRGFRPLPGTDARRYWSQVPKDEFWSEQKPVPVKIRYNSDGLPYVDLDEEDDLRRAMWERRVDDDG